MNNWVGTLSTGQAHYISLWITYILYELPKSNIKNPPGLVLDYQIAYTILNTMVVTMKIVWAEAPMVNVST